MNIHIVGFKECQYSQRALQAADVLRSAGVVGEVSDQIFERREDFQDWLAKSTSNSVFGQLGPEARQHTTSPICWSEEGGRCSYIGGCKEFESLAGSLLDSNVEVSGAVSTAASALDSGASLDRFFSLVKSNKFTGWVFWRGLW